jgi:hypothetical protein
MIVRDTERVSRTATETPLGTGRRERRDGRRQRYPSLDVPSIPDGESLATLYYASTTRKAAIEASDFEYVLALVDLGWIRRVAAGPPPGTVRSNSLPGGETPRAPRPRIVSLATRRTGEGVFFVEQGKDTYRSMRGE